MMQSRPICHVVAGPNGSGKSTFALSSSLFPNPFGREAATDP